MSLGEQPALSVARYLRADEQVVPFRDARSGMNCWPGVEPTGASKYGW